MDHQTLGWWDDRPSDPAYYIEDCRISIFHSLTKSTLPSSNQKTKQLSTQSPGHSVVSFFSNEIAVAWNLLLFNQYKFVTIMTIRMFIQNFWSKLKTKLEYNYNFSCYIYEAPWQIYDTLLCEVTMNSIGKCFVFFSTCICV